MHLHCFVFNITEDFWNCRKRKRATNDILLAKDVIPITRSKTCKWYKVCPIKQFTDQGLLDRKWVEQYCLKGNINCFRYQMEAKGQYHPDNMLPNGTIDESLPE